MGIKKIENENFNVTIYPNPFSNTANIVVNNSNKTVNLSIKMYNILGEIVLNEVLQSQTNSFQTSNLQSGIYTYKIISNNEVLQSGKIISNN